METVETKGQRQAGARSVDGAREIVVLGAKEHNLQNIDVRIPRDKLVVVTGLSGSGKSSLAFDTIYAEGQRKYVESLSAYARQFLEQLSKPDVEHIEGLPPTVAIEQRVGGANPRSTVATTTEIYDYLRLFFARVGDPHCWICGRAIASQTVSQIVDSVMTLPEGTRFLVLAPIVRGQKGQHQEAIRGLQREGYVRARIDGAIFDLKAMPELDKNRKHTIEIVVDRLVMRETVRVRLSDSVETALKLSTGLAVISYEEIATAGSAKPQADVAISRKAASDAAKKDETSGNAAQWKDRVFSAVYACPEHSEASLEELSPRMFSFNSPYGACEACDGLGTILEFDPELIVPDGAMSLQEGAVDAWRHQGKRMNIWYNRMIRWFCRSEGVSPSTPWQELPADARKRLMYGDGEDFEGVIPNLTRRRRNTDSEFVKNRLHSFLSEQPCRQCKARGSSRPLWR